LASRSPQRRAILEQLGLPFRVLVSSHDEGVRHGDPATTVAHNAQGKALDVLARAALADDELVLGVDTVVVLDDRILGKAADEKEAAAYLGLLRARRHEVFSGLHLCSREHGVTAYAVTAVTFRDLDDAEVTRYVATGEWRERAGAYAIQGFGSALIAAVEGDYWNVVGLPVPLLMASLTEFSIPALSWLDGGGGQERSGRP
jgi:septum formation protein